MILAIFVPNKDTLVEMQIAQVVTKSNIELTVESIKDIVDYIVQSIASLK